MQGPDSSPRSSPAHESPAATPNGVDDLSPEALSAAVALEVMGWRRDGTLWLPPGGDHEDAPQPASEPSFSIDPREASAAVGRVLADGWHCTLHVQPGGCSHTVTLWRRPDKRLTGQGQSMPQAVCRAILKLTRSRWRSRRPHPA